MKKGLNKYLFVFVAMALFSCKEDNPIVPLENDFSHIYNLPDTPYNYSNITFPETFTNYVMSLNNETNDNPVTDHGATLGRVLFYDKKLSRNNTVSCASCHVQEFGFSDPRTKSVGFLGEETRRNSMNLANSGFYQPGKYFWDHRANSIEEQVLMPIEDEVEMGMNLSDLITKLEELEYYKPLFQNAFGNEEIAEEKIGKALAQFVRAIYSFNSKYDRGIEITRDIFEDFPNFTAQENLGKDIFNGRLTPESNGTCAFCHMVNVNTLHFTVPVDPEDNQVIFSGHRTDNLGLDENSHGDVDNGLGEITDVDSDNGEFKTPSIRNIEVTGPYMHDGRFATLEEVVEHYSTGVEDHPYLSEHMINPDFSPRHLNLTEEQKAALVAFLKTLTDHDMLNDPKYSDPFVE